MRRFPSRTNNCSKHAARQLRLVLGCYFSAAAHPGSFQGSIKETLAGEEAAGGAELAADMERDGALGNARKGGIWEERLFSLTTPIVTFEGRPRI